MSMIAPEVYIEELQDKTYKEILVFRNQLLNEIKDFEEHIEQIMTKQSYLYPSPDVVYQWNLWTVSLIFKLLQEKFNEEYE